MKLIKPKKNKFHQKSLRIAFIFSSFFVLLITGIIMIGITYLVTVFQPFGPNPIVPIVFLVCISIVLGTFFFGMVSTIILKPVNEISEATKAVSKGDFSVRLDEDQRIVEMQDIFKNFNQMVRELSSIETLREDFVVNVSHEFKTPIAAIEGSATLLQDEDLTLKERQEFTNMIIDASQHLSSLVGNVLRISKLESTEVPIEHHSFQLDEQIREVILLLENQWTEKNIELEIDLDEVVYNGNEELLYQVWRNLLDNAIKYSEDGGKIFIALYRTKAGCSFQIEDNGVGMTKNGQRHIFEKFYQENNSTSISGNGLGLALVKTIIDQHGGSIVVKSVAGEGSTFIVRLT